METSSGIVMAGLFSCFSGRGFQWLPAGAALDEFFELFARQPQVLADYLVEEAPVDFLARMVRNDGRAAVRVLEEHVAPRLPDEAETKLFKYLA